MTPKEEILKIQRDTEKIKQINQDLKNVLNALDNLALVARAEEMANAQRL